MANQQREPSIKVVCVSLEPSVVDHLKLQLMRRGFSFIPCPDIETAEEEVAEGVVDFVVSFFHSPFSAEIAERIARWAVSKNARWIAVCEGIGLTERLRLYELGVDELAEGPVSTGELAARLEVLQAERLPGNSNRGSDQPFEGSLRDMSLEDIIHLLQVGNRSGMVTLRSGGKEGYIFARDGRVIDALLDGMPPQRALSQMLLWIDGEFSLEFGDCVRPERLGDEVWDCVKDSSYLRKLLLEDSHNLPAVTAPLARLEESPEADLAGDERLLLELLDGRRTLIELLDHAPFDPEYVLELVRGLKAKGLIAEVAEEEEPLLVNAALGAGAQRALAAVPLLLGVGRVNQGRPGLRRARRIFRGRQPNRPGLSRTELIQIRQSLLSDREAEVGGRPTAERKIAPDDGRSLEKAGRKADQSSP